LQTPVEAYYFKGRQLSSKMVVPPDSNIATVVSFALWQSLVDNFQAFGLGPHTPLSALIEKYENILFYQHNSIPTPPITLGEGINEVMFMPHLYSAIPPVCNVIFKDQIIAQSVTRNYLAEPTRVVATFDNKLTSTGDIIPEVVMANAAGVLAVTQNASQAATPELASTHDFLSSEECLKGVVIQPATIGYEALTSTTPEVASPQGGATTLLQWNNFKTQAVLHHWNMAGGRPRTAELTCSFLPYLVPGFPCLVEDSTGPFFGIISGLSHSLPCTGSPSTTVHISFVRESYVGNGPDKTPVIPPWLNSIYWPSQINSTYRTYLACNAISAGLTGNIPAAGSGQINMDILACQVVPVPVYSPTTLITSSSTMSTQTVADHLRQGSPGATQLAMLTYQYRSGTTIDEYWDFHGMDYISNNPNESIGAASDPLWASPQGLVFSPTTGQIPIGDFGYYAAVGDPYLPLRRTNTNIIKQAIQKRITNV
jgi:hypothetical protein